MWVKLQQIGPPAGFMTRYKIADWRGEITACRDFQLTSKLENKLRGMVSFDVRDLGEAMATARVAYRRGKGGYALITASEHGGAIVEEVRVGKGDL